MKTGGEMHAVRIRVSAGCCKIFPELLSVDSCNGRLVLTDPSQLGQDLIGPVVDGKWIPPGPDRLVRIDLGWDQPKRLPALLPDRAGDDLHCPEYALRTAQGCGIVGTADEDHPFGVMGEDFPFQTFQKIRGCIAIFEDDPADHQLRAFLQELRPGFAIG